jgi:transcriptional regulator with XRE-family HTH domain
MAVFLNRPLGDLLVRGREALRMTQDQLGEALGASLRTVQRWDAGDASPNIVQVRTLAQLVFPKNRALAAELADVASETLESLGLARPGASPTALRGALIDAILCAAADAMGARPSAARAGLVAAFARARELGVGVDELEARLKEPRGEESAR